MKLLKTALSALCALCLLLSMLPAASAALEEDERFTGKSWLEIVEEFNERLSVRPQNVAYGYYNTVKDKIIAYPKGQQFRWTMLNLGSVHIHGVDIEAEADLQPLPGLTVTGRVQYTYQDARDVTDPSTPYYRDQIPYIPWHSGSAILGLAYKGFDVNYSFIYAGKRYNEQENIIYNHMEPWYTNDISLSYGFKRKKTTYKLTLEVNNLLSQDYDVIVNYPMPKRNYVAGIKIEY